MFVRVLKQVRDKERWYVTSAVNKAHKSVTFLGPMAREQISLSSKKCRSSVALIAERVI